MAEDRPSSARQMSLIPYAHDTREIVLRRGNAVVVYDSTSRQLSVRDAADQPVELPNCPYCHRPLRREPSPEDGEHYRSFQSERPFVDPEYFSMLAASQRPSPDASGESVSNRRVHAALRSGRSREVSGSTAPVTGAEFVGSEPATSTEQGISASAFSPGYFQQFFREERELGRGGNGVVLLVEHMIDGASLGHFACKRIPVGNSKAYFEKVIIEVRLLQNIPHKNLVAYHWTWLEDHQPSKFGPKIPCLWILQDYCNGGDLHNHVLGPQPVRSATEELKNRMRRRSKGDGSPPRNLRSQSRLSFDEIFSYFRDITSGLHHLHSKGYIHRDLKPSNCLLQHAEGRTRVLISDFGEVQATGAVRGSSGATGTISYCAPEVLQRGLDGALGNFSVKSDIFSLGMVVYFMAFGRLPYLNADGFNEENEDLELLRAEITKWQGFNDDARARPELPDKLYRFLRRLLSVDPNQRPSTGEILASIKHGVAHEDAGWSFEDHNPRVTKVDSPAPKPSSRTQRKSSYLSNSGAVSPIRRRSSSNVRSRSPQKQSQSLSRPMSPLGSSMDVAPRKVDLPPPSTADHPSPQQSPRLMLPPPPDRPIFSGFAQLLYQPQTVIASRAALFLAKVLSLSMPCAPYAANAWLLYPLLGVAALDLGLLQFSLRRTLVLVTIHVVVIMLAAQRARLCEAGNVLVWDDI